RSSPNRCWPSTTKPTCPRKWPTRWAWRTRSTACRRLPTQRRTLPDAPRDRTGRAGPGAAGVAAAGDATAGRRAARQDVVDVGGAPGGVRAAAAGAVRVPGPDGVVRDAGLLGALRRGEFELPAAGHLPLHRRVGIARRLAAA